MNAKRILVTGSSGFLGSFVADELTERGYEVTLFDCKPSAFKKYGQKECIGNLLDMDYLLEVTNGVDVVYHYAGMADIGMCADNPRKVVENNVVSTVNLLEACRMNKVKRFCFASSAYVFSNHGSFYRSSKRACESFIQDYYKKYGLDYVILRYGSLYGPRSNESNGLYRIIKSMLEVETEYHHNGAADECREYIHVIDAARLSVDVIEREYKQKIFMITGMERFKMEELVQMIQEILGKDVPVTFTSTLQDHYKITPYHYNIDGSYKLVINPYHDIGQGIIDIIKDINHVHI